MEINPEIISVGITAVAAASFLALVLERLMEYLIAPIWLFLLGIAIKLLDVDSDGKGTLPFVAAILGIGFAAAWSLDIISPTLNTLGWTVTEGWPGILISGLVIGGGSNLLHDLWPSSS